MQKRMENKSANVERRFGEVRWLRHVNSVVLSILFLAYGLTLAACCTPDTEETKRCFCGNRVVSTFVVRIDSRRGKVCNAAAFKAWQRKCLSTIYKPGEGDPLHDRRKGIDLFDINEIPFDEAP